MAMPKSLLELSVEYLHENFDKFDKDTLKLILAALQRVRKMTLEKFLEVNHESCGAEASCNERFFAALPWLTRSPPKQPTEKFSLSEHVVCRNSKLSNSTLQECIRCLPPTLDIIHLKFQRDWRLCFEEREAYSIATMQCLGELIISGIAIRLSGILTILQQCKKLEYVEIEDVEMDVELPSSVISDSFVDFQFDGTNLRNRSISCTMENEAPYLMRKMLDLPHYVSLSVQPKTLAELNLVQELHAYITQFCMSFQDLEDVDALDQFPYFPEVRGATVECSSFALENCPTNVPTLNVLRTFFVRNGQSLTFLRIIDLQLAPEQMTLEQLFELCPNIQSVRFSNSILSGKNVPTEHLRCLRQVVWAASGSEMVIPLGSILSAPLLEEFIVGNDIDFGDGDALVARIARREILKNLEFCYFDKTSIRKTDFDGEANFYARLIQNINFCIDKQNEMIDGSRS